MNELDFLTKSPPPPSTRLGKASKNKSDPPNQRTQPPTHLENNDYYPSLTTSKADF